MYIYIYVNVPYILNTVTIIAFLSDIINGKVKKNRRINIFSYWNCKATYFHDLDSILLYLFYCFQPTLLILQFPSYFTYSTVSNLLCLFYSFHPTLHILQFPAYFTFSTVSILLYLYYSLQPTLLILQFPYYFTYSTVSNLLYLFTASILLYLFYSIYPTLLIHSFHPTLRIL